MNIVIRRNSPYKHVVIEDAMATIDLGLLDADECRALASEFQEAADDLLHGLPEQRK